MNESFAWKGCTQASMSNMFRHLAFSSYKPTKMTRRTKGTETDAIHEHHKSVTNIRQKSFPRLQRMKAKFSTETHTENLWKQRWRERKNAVTFQQDRKVWKAYKYKKRQLVKAKLAESMPFSFNLKSFVTNFFERKDDELRVGKMWKTLTHLKYSPDVALTVFSVAR